MRKMTRRDVLVFGTISAAVATGNLGMSADETPEHLQALSDRLDLATHKGRAFLVVLLDPQLDLLPEYPDANDYWLFNDNYLAAKVLNESHPQIARRIQTAIKREGIEHSGKIELLFDELKDPLPFRQNERKNVRNVQNKAIRTDVMLTEPTENWENYANLLLMACIAETKPAAARRRWHEVNKMWDGKGFADATMQQNRRYSTYKLALALIAANKLQVKSPTGALETLLSMQADSGGWITDYDGHGQKIGLANVETTSLSIMGIEAHKSSNPIRVGE